jgi:membrane protein DedA with SNARE-associated domain
MRRALKIMAFPLAVLAVFGLLYAIWLALDLPPEDTLIAIAKNYLDRYGLAIVLVCAYLEALLVIGWYFPGTLVIIVALIVAAAEPVRYAETAAIGGLGLLPRPVTNFFAGKYGWYRLLLAFGLREPSENAKRRLIKYGLSAIFTTFWQANLASCISTAAGICNFLRGASSCWPCSRKPSGSCSGRALIFLLGPAALSLAGFRMILLLILIWIAARLIYRWKFEKRNKPEAS